MQGIYEISNTVTGRRYVGRAQNATLRWVEHTRALERGAHINQRIQEDWNAHGATSFVFTVRELIGDARQLSRRELEIIHAERPAYNATSADPSPAILDARKAMAARERTHDPKEWWENIPACQAHYGPDAFHDVFHSFVDDQHQISVYDPPLLPLERLPLEMQEWIASEERRLGVACPLWDTHVQSPLRH